MSIVPQISTSSFKPLSLDEIMMVPMAKQRMEDDLLDEVNQFSGLTSDVLEADRERASNIINDFKSKSQEIASEIIEKGVDRSQFRKIRDLKTKLGREMTTGFVGRAMANKKLSKDYMKKISENKDFRGGYSSLDGQRWGKSQIDKFNESGGTYSADGSYRTFSGSGMAQKFNENKFIEDSIKEVARTSSGVTMKEIEVGGLAAFQKAIQTNKIQARDFNKIVRHIAQKASTTPELLNHLQQQAFFTGDKNPLDLGSFDKKGDYIMGGSRFARKLAGMALTGSQPLTNIDTKIFADPVLKKMYENGTGGIGGVMLKFQNGEITNLTPDSLDKIREDFESYEQTVDVLESDVKKKEFELKSKGIPQDQWRNDSEYNQMLKDFSQAKSSEINTRNYLDQLEKESFDQLSDSDKSLFELEKILVEDYGNDPLRILVEVYGEDPKNLRIPYAEKFKNIKNAKDKELYEKYLKEEALKFIGRKMNIDQATSSSHGIFFGERFNSILNAAKERRNDIIQDNLDARKKGVFYEKIVIPKGSKYSTSKFKDYSDLSASSIIPKATELVGKNMNLQEYMETDEYKDMLGIKSDDDVAQIEVLQNFTIDGYDKEGRKFDELLIRNKKDPTKMIVAQKYSDNDTYSMSNQLFLNMYNKGNNTQKQKATMGMANNLYMPAIKKSNLRYNKQGTMVLNLPDGTSTDDVTYSKNDDGTYEVTFLGLPATYKGESKLKGEQEISLALYETINDFMKAKQEREKNKKA